MQYGQFIVIEGPDGSGKGEQQIALIKRFKTELGISVTIVDFPQYETTVFGEIVGKMLANKYGNYQNIDPELAIFPYALDRWSAKEKIIKALQNDKIVIANRYTLSNLAHQSARVSPGRRKSLINLINKIEYKELQIPKPDLYIHLDVPIKITRELLRKKKPRSYLGKVKKDALEADLEHQLQAAKMYKKLGNTMPGITRINCMKNGKLMSISEIHEIVWTTVRKFVAI